MTRYFWIKMKLWILVMTAKEVIDIFFKFVFSFGFNRYENNLCEF